MQLALVDGERQKAQPNLSGECQCCESPMISKCGEDRIWHWAHKSRQNCDPWWEETEWHRAWKNCFPEDWQEIVLYSECGEKHIADVKTTDGWVIEFQHSPIKADERASREAFYERLVWVINGKRRKFDEQKFKEAWEDAGRPFGPEAPLRALSFFEGRLLNEWVGRPSHVLLDFGEEDWLWWLIPKCDQSSDFVLRTHRAAFIQCLGPVADRGELSLENVVEGVENAIRRLHLMHKIEQSVRVKQRSNYDPLAMRRPPRRRL